MEPILTDNKVAWRSRFIFVQTGSISKGKSITQQSLLYPKGTVASHNTYYCDVLTFFDVYVWNYYVLKLLRLETIMFSDAMLSNINVVLCYVLSQYTLK